MSTFRHSFRTKLCPVPRASFLLFLPRPILRCVPGRDADTPRAALNTTRMSRDKAAHPLPHACAVCATSCDSTTYKLCVYSCFTLFLPLLNLSSFVCRPTGPNLPLRLARRPNRGHIGGRAFLASKWVQHLYPRQQRNRCTNSALSADGISEDRCRSQHFQRTNVRKRLNSPDLCTYMVRRFALKRKLRIHRLFAPKCADPESAKAARFAVSPNLG